MGKLFRRMIYISVIVLSTLLPTSCVIDGDNNHKCWLADPKLSYRYNEVNNEYTLEYNETRTIVLCWAGSTIPLKATCSFNGG